MSTPTDRQIISVAGWSPKYARVLARASLSRVAAAVIDTNVGDGRMVEFEMMHLDDDGVWRTVYSTGAGTFGTGSGSVLGVVHAHGHNPGAPYVVIEFGGRQSRVEVAEGGWWVFLALTDDASIEPPVVKGV